MAWNRDENFLKLISKLPSRAVPPEPDGGQQRPCGISNKNYTAAPAGTDSWGLQGCTFRSKKDAYGNRVANKGPIDCQSYERNGNGLTLYAKEAQGRLGFVRCIQGMVWKGNVGWYVPPVPLAIKTHPNLRVFLELEHHKSVMYSGNSWVMQAINVWLASPHILDGRKGEKYQKAVRPPDNKGNRAILTNPDRYGNKALVLDLMFWFNKAGANFQRADESEDAFHYQRMVQAVPPGTGKSFMVNLSHYINDAFRLIPTLAPIPDWELWQLEYVIEVSNAEGEATVRHFRLEG